MHPTVSRPSPGARTLRPDAILMDVSMPHMDGVEATACIRTELHNIRILGLSMLARNETADAIEHAAAAGFFVKGTDTLLDRLPAGLSRIPRR
jgi:DNA-binding NarL/FixJ family response regulator